MSATRRLTRRGLAVLTGVGLLLFLAVWVFPVAWTIVTSLKLPIDIFSYPPKIIFDPTALNYSEITVGRESLLDDLRTSVIVATSTTALTMAVAIPMAYAFARLDFRWKGGLGLYTLFTYLIPRIGLVIPHFVVLQALGLTNTHIGLIIVYLSFSLPLAMWLMVSYFEDIPDEIEEAARIDRASRLQTLWHVSLPQVRGGMGVTAIFVFITAWNEFLFAVVLSGNDVRPVTVSMYNFISVEQTLWGPLTAAAIVAMLPVVALGLVVQKQIIHGLSAGAVKE